jgi:hypothetical protein
MSVNDKYEAAQSILREHNEAIGGPEKAGYVDSDKFISCIKTAGGTSEERLRSFSYEEILQCLPDTDGVKPVAIAKDIAKVFRGKDDKPENEKRPISSKKAERMTLKELVENFDPEETSNAVGKRLKAIAGREKFIVYNQGRLVDVETTFKILQEIKQGYEGRDDIEVDGDIKRVYALGEIPDQYADENPLWHGRPLRPDGTCDQMGRSWEGVDKRVRQFVRIAVDLDLFDVSIDKAHDVLDMALKSDAWKELRKRYREAAVEFDELEKQNQLPHLQIPIGREEKPGKGGSFPKGKKVEWVQPSMTANYYQNTRGRGKGRGTNSGDIAR